jgi:hypothetical protein
MNCPVAREGGMFKHGWFADKFLTALVALALPGPVR